MAENAKEVIEKHANPKACLLEWVVVFFEILEIRAMLLNIEPHRRIRRTAATVVD